MALHTETDIYASCYDLLGAAGTIVLNMRRDARRVFGDKIIDACIALDLHVRAANKAADKEPHIEDLLERLEVVEIIARTCRDHRYIVPSQYGVLIQHTQSIGKQANGWKRSEKERRAPKQQGLPLVREEVSSEPGRALF